MNIIDQFRETKKKHPDMILLFRVGDFYECFEDDAFQVANLCGTTFMSLTDKKTGTTTRIAGFPHQSLETYLHKLIKTGKRVAILEPVTDAPKSAKITTIRV